MAARTARLRQRMLTSDLDVAATTEMLSEIEKFTLKRKLVEDKADTIGVPARWVHRAQELGRAGHTWSDEQLFPQPVRSTGRKAVSRLAQDTRQLTDMAAVTAVRTHRLTIEGIEWEPAPSAARQFRTNMQALWTRSARAADAIRLKGQEPGQPWDTSDAEWQHLLRHYMEHPLHHVDESWRRYTAPSIAEKANHSLTELRRTMHATPKPPSAVDWEEPPRPDVLIRRAQEALHTLLRDRLDADPPRTRAARRAGTSIGAAITDIMPPAAAALSWYAAPHLNNRIPPAAEAQRDIGADP
ncbi:hypothetical protein IU459_35380 [Nocardia amamiensis]|uniref:Uncharacterized protein n=1 Tax=Nocardia amamiensis TaxID=404578 RepID=A0ABS0D3T7_9NOCA|nr:hypothetical protein [Nocardia amamiensis]MBF6302778.1 hypothetical protein [Nocardia amamiensis]